MAVTRFPVTIIEKKEIAPQVYLVKTHSDDKPLFQAGQYFSVQVAHKVNRAYSAASAPGENTLDFLVDTSPGGLGSQFFLNHTEGDSFDLLGPVGFFTLEQHGVFGDEEPLVFIATGTGIAPIRSMIVELLIFTKVTRKVILYFGLRYDSESYFFEEFTDLAEEYENFEFVPVISRPSALWQGECGYCQEVVTSRPLVGRSRVFICGVTETVKAISADLIKHGYPEEAVFFEKFG